MIAPTGKSEAERFVVPRAINKSRSVTTPTTWPESSRTGRTPQSRVHIISAAAAALVPGLQNDTLVVITSSTLIVGSASCLFRFLVFIEEVTSRIIRGCLGEPLEKLLVFTKKIWNMSVM
jgi:hypothetical protein